MPPSNPPSSTTDPLSALLLQVNAPPQRAKRADAGLRPQAPEAKALVLVTTVYTCECGETYRSPNPHVLVRYDSHGLQNSVHYSRATLNAVHTTQREHKLILRSVPYCEACFSIPPPR